MYLRSFHPRDLGNDCGTGFYAASHENDSEAVRVVIEKDGANWGRMGWIEATRHDTFCSTYFPTLIDGSPPAIYVCEKKQAIYCTNKAEGWDCSYLHDPLGSCRIFPGKDGTGVGYHYAGRGAEVPSSLNDRDVSYELISMESTLWPKRFDSLTYRTCWAFVSGGYNWDEELQLCGHALSEFGAKFNGDNYSLFGSKCAASAPWVYAFEAAGWGKWFIDPLFFYGAWHCDGSGEQYI